MTRNVQRGVVNPPNNTHAAPVGHSAGVASEPPGTHAANDPRRAPIGSSANLAHTNGGVTPPNRDHRFNVEDAHKGWDVPPATPGKGAVPVNPFGVSGGIVPAYRVADRQK